MIKGRVATFALVLPCFLHSMGQDTTSASSARSLLPSVTIGTGFVIFNGDLAKRSTVNPNGRITHAMHISIEERFTKSLGVSLGASYGYFEHSEQTTTLNRNFRSPLLQVDLNFIYHFDNDRLFKRHAFIGPYISAGAGFLKFDPHGDLFYNGNKPYYYWSDGSIRDQPEANANLITAKDVSRDYDYETQLQDSLNSYSRSTVSFPLSAGVAIKFTKAFNAVVASSYNFTMSDHIDNVKEGGTDSYLYSSVSLRYNFGMRVKKENPSKHVDFDAIDAQDLDGDGVRDLDDNCPGTPRGAKVDAKGCHEGNK